MRTITVARYVTPLREGGSLPAVVEGDDEGLYVLKFRGAGQGPKALVAELIAGELARALGLPVPEIVLAELDPELARTEPDSEIQDLIRASAGLNLALDYLPGSMGFDPAVDRVSREFASQLAWFDALVCNVDRTARNTNLLLWHRKPWLIDHGAALYFHHGWDGSMDGAASRFPMIKDHVLLPAAESLAAADAALAPRVTAECLDAILGQVPDAWLASDVPTLATPSALRVAYGAWFAARLAGRAGFLQEAIDARA